MHTPKFEHISFDIRNLYQFDDLIIFDDKIETIEIIIDENTRFSLNLDEGTYIDRYGFVKAFGLSINFDLDDFKGAKKIIMPSILKDKFSKDLHKSRIFEIKQTKENYKGFTYNVLTNDYE